MRLGKWVLGLAALGLLFCGTATAQYQPNELCINAGAQSWAGGPGYGGYGFPNHGMGKYYPSFTHWAGTEFPPGSFQYPWKINGWGWNTMQGSTTSSFWYFSTCLHKSWDNPYDTTVYGTPPNTHTGMGWDYPRNFCLGVGDSGALPDFIWGGTLPGVLPAIGGDHGFIFPSSYQGDDTYWNVFAVYSGGVTTGMPTPFTIWSFSLAGTCQGIWTVPSSHSVYEFVWTCRPQCAVSQYMNLSAYEYDCSGTVGGLIGNKARNYTIMGDYDNGRYWGWGASIEGGMCLLLCDIVTIPVNIPGSSQNPVVTMNPYAGLGFDVGSATLTPFATSGCVQLSFMTQANQSPGAARIITGEFNGPITATTPWVWADPSTGAPPQCPLIVQPGVRVPHAWWIVANLLVNNAVLAFLHTPTAGFPAQFFASSVGANTFAIPMPADPALHCAEIRFASLDLYVGPGAPVPPQDGGASSASYMATYW